MNKVYEDKPDTGVMFNTKEKMHDRSPDLTGHVVVSPELVAELAKLVNAKKPAKIRLAAWHKDSKAGNRFLSLRVSADRPRSNDEPF